MESSKSSWTSCSRAATVIDDNAGNYHKMSNCNSNPIVLKTQRNSVIFENVKQELIYIIYFLYFLLGHLRGQANTVFRVTKLSKN